MHTCPGAPWQRGTVELSGGCRTGSAFKGNVSFTGKVEIFTNPQKHQKNFLRVWFGWVGDKENPFNHTVFVQKIEFGFWSRFN